MTVANLEVARFDYNFNVFVTVGSRLWKSFHNRAALGDQIINFRQQANSSFFHCTIPGHDVIEISMYASPNGTRYLVVYSLFYSPKLEQVCSVFPIIIDFHSNFNMSFLRASTTFSSLTRRTVLSSRNLSTTVSLFAQGYGDGNGDPKGENPQFQGSSNHETQKREHPGPEPPSSGKGTGAGPAKTGNKAPEEASTQSGGSRSKDAKETGSSPTGGSIDGGKSQDGASPKIHDRNEPGAHSDEKQAEVDKHNREFEQRHDRAAPAQKDKVDKKFWDGEFNT